MQRRRETRLGGVGAPAIYLRCLNALLFSSSFILGDLSRGRVAENAEFVIFGIGI